MLYLVSRAKKFLSLSPALNQVKHHSSILSSFSSTIISLLPEPLDVVECSLFILEHIFMALNIENRVYLKWRQQQSITPHSGSRQSQLQDTIWENEMEVQGEQVETLQPPGWQQVDDDLEYLKIMDLELWQAKDRLQLELRLGIAFFELILMRKSQFLLFIIIYQQVRHGQISSGRIHFWGNGIIVMRLNWI